MKENSVKAYRKFDIGESNNYVSNLNVVFDIPLPCNIDFKHKEQQYCEKQLEEFMQLLVENGFSVLNGVYAVKGSDTLYQNFHYRFDQQDWEWWGNLNQKELNFILNRGITDNELYRNKNWVFDLINRRFDPHDARGESDCKVLPDKIIRMIIVVEYKLLNVHTVQPEFDEIIESIRKILVHRFYLFSTNSVFVSHISDHPIYSSIFCGRIKEIQIDYTKTHIGMMPKGKWECKYCEGLNDDSDNSCSHCGASRTRDCMSWEMKISDNVIARDLSSINIS